MHPCLNKLVLLISLLIASAFACVVVSSGHDDSHITFWQARTLLEYGELWNYNGERIEQSSSLLHVLLTALLSGVGSINPVNAGYLVNILGGLACILLLYLSALQQANKLPGRAVLFVCSSTFFCTGCFQVWKHHWQLPVSCCYYIK